MTALHQDLDREDRRQSRAWDYLVIVVLVGALTIAGTAGVIETVGAFYDSVVVGLAAELTNAQG